MARIAVRVSKPSQRVALRRFCEGRGHEVLSGPAERTDAPEADVWIVDGGPLPPAALPPRGTIVVLGEKEGYDAGESGAVVSLPLPIDFRQLGRVLDGIAPRPGEDCLLLEETVSGRPPLLFRGEPMASVVERLEKLAQVDLAVLLQGETGTGKELAARIVHDAGPRSTEPFVAVHCGAIPAELLESELFGHRRGAFTDAGRDHRGHFERAAAGTLFLDEIAEMPLPLQAKLLRALQAREFHPVGAEEGRPFRARVVAATAADLAARVQDGTFRPDLYHRLAGAVVEIPPLRQRPRDLEVLLAGLGARARAEIGGPVRGFLPEALAHLRRHSWPGNVRELENFVRRCVALGQEELLSRATVARELRGGPAPGERFEQTVLDLVRTGQKAGWSPHLIRERCFESLDRILSGAEEQPARGADAPSTPRE